ncbi:MAG: DUF1987 domain-containing protein [Bacteroidales bacterium]|nr:DUF1987 domain-containing protein [Bacteroidales bacterium]
MKLEIEKTLDTPYIFLDIGIIKIEGRSMPENVLKFYAPVKEWLNDYLKSPEKLTTIHLNLPYTNSSSIKQINDILRILDAKYIQGSDMKIIWTYEDGDESILETGQDLESIVSIPFEYEVSETEAKQRIRLRVRNKKTGKEGEISQRYWETIKRNGHEKDFEVLGEV